MGKENLECRKYEAFQVFYVKMLQKQNQELY